MRSALLYPCDQEDAEPDLGRYVEFSSRRAITAPTGFDDERHPMNGLYCDAEPVGCEDAATDATR